VAAFFLDSSALAKCYVNEVGSGWVRSIVAPAAGHDVHVVRIAEVELTSVMVRRRKAGALSTAAVAAALGQLRRDFASEYLVLNVSDQLLAAAVALVETHELRAYDGVQLAAAVRLNHVRISGGLSALTFVSADQELNAAAQSEGLFVEDPNMHP
jgi:predicted nucleic acid-binding protein